MRHVKRRRTALVSAVAVAAVATGLALVVRGGDDPVGPTAQSQAQAVGGQGSELLGAPFESESAGISLRIPRGMQRVRSSNAGDDIAQFAHEKKKWELKLSRALRQTPTSLGVTTDNNGKTVPGLLDVTVANLKRDLSGSTVLRQDLINIADAGLGEGGGGGGGGGGARDRGESVVPRNNVGMIAIRFGAAGGHYVTQQAIVQATDRLFYLIALTTPVTEASGPGVEPGADERAAVETFRAMLDSVRLLDTAAIVADQKARLVRTRALLVQFKNKQRVQSALIGEQWLRVLRNGHDVGYSYVTEENAAGVPRPLTPKEVAEGKGDRELVKPGDGVLVGIRSRMINPPEAAGTGGAEENAKPRGPVQVDNATWLFVGREQELEDWSRITVVADGTKDADGKPVRRQVVEYGSSTVQVKSELDTAIPPGEKGDAKQPPVVIRRHHRLDVTTVTDTGVSDPTSQELPVFYLPQATGHLLPRLLPLAQRSADDVRTYMFATYVPDTRQVMSRYVEVGSEGDFELAGRRFRAVPVTDRLGWRGSVTTHYLTRTGQYLGSENKDSHTIVVPSDAATLVSIWKGANLTRPDAASARPQIGAGLGGGGGGAAPATQPGPAVR